MPRTRSYTARGIRRLKCFRAGCSNRAATQWQICSDGRVFRPVCLPCDIELNRLVLEWAGFADAAEKLEAYRERAMREHGMAA
jgi:hypothetical protein